MPFTPAHTVVVLPFLRSRRFLATGLIIGSISPDFEYFLKMSVNSEFSHTLAGIFYFDIPVSVVLALLFHEVVKLNFINNLPLFLQHRLQAVRNNPFRETLRQRPVAFLLSVLLGAASHLAWDGFTHNNGFFVSELPFIYEGSYIPYDGARYPLWYALQHVSTFVGLTLLAFYIMMMKPETGIVYTPRLQYWIYALLISVLIVLVRFQFDLSDSRIGNIVVTSVSAFCIAVTLLGFIPFTRDIAPGLEK